MILATNFRQNMDDAFLRRLDVVVDFPFPEAEDRERIWRLVLPAAAPVADDVDIRFLASAVQALGRRDPQLLARARRSWPPRTAEPIAMRHLVRAVALEYGKLGRLTLEADFEQFTDLIRPQTGSFPKIT